MSSPNIRFYLTSPLILSCEWFTNCMTAQIDGNVNLKVNLSTKNNVGELSIMWKNVYDTLLSKTPELMTASTV